MANHPVPAMEAEMRADLPGESGASSFYISKHPSRKRVVLWRSKGTVLRPIAYFHSEEYAHEFMDFVDAGFGIVPSPEYHGWSLRPRP